MSGMRMRCKHDGDVENTETTESNPSTHMRCSHQLSVGMYMYEYEPYYTYIHFRIGSGCVLSLSPAAAV